MICTLWQIRDVKHGKVFSFKTLEDLIDFVMKLNLEKSNV